MVKSLDSRIPSWSFPSLPSCEALGTLSASLCLSFLIYEMRFRIVLTLKVVLWNKWDHPWSAKHNVWNTESPINVNDLEKWELSYMELWSESASSKRKTILAMVFHVQCFKMLSKWESYCWMNFITSSTKALLLFSFHLMKDSRITGPISETWKLTSWCSRNLHFLQMWPLLQDRRGAGRSRWYQGAADLKWCHLY